MRVLGIKIQLFLCIARVCTRSDQTRDISKCIAGEQWSEDCMECVCHEHGKTCMPIKKCQKEKCFLDGAVWLTRESRKHCMKENGNKVVVTVANQFQNDLNGKICPEEAKYFYDGCSRCDCVDNKNIALCVKGRCDSLDGLCRPGERAIETCAECFCTRTMFRICRPLKDCMIPRAGRCPEPEVVLPGERGPWSTWICVMLKRHRCLHDAECDPGSKCCLQDCSLRCMEPLFEIDSSNVHEAKRSYHKY